MNNGQSNGRGSAFPVVAAVVLLGTFAVLLWFILSEADLVHQAQQSYPLPTAIPPTEVAAATAETTATMDVTDAVAPDTTAEATAEGPATEATAEEGTEVAAAPTEGPLFDPAQVAAGKAAFDTVCIACHGIDARGVPGLGKDLVHSEFVHGLSDEELVQFIITGRPAFDPANTTGIEMPARGGNPTITDEQIEQIVVYLRSLAAEEGIIPVQAGAAEPAQATTAPEEAAAEPAPTTVAAAPAAETEWVPPVPGGTPVAARPIADSPQGLYLWSCSTCHGIDGQGNAPYGPGILDSDLLDPANEEQLVAFLIAGDDYEGAQGGFVHPPRGGYPALTDEQVTELAAYLQGLAGE